MRTVMDNLNLTVETVSRTIQFGKDFHCDASFGDITVPRDCTNPLTGSDSIAIKASDGRRFVYKLVGSRIARTIDGGPDYFLTSSDVTITSLSFRVFGSPHFVNGPDFDLYQPQVIITVSGYAGVKANSKSTFSLETTVSQRIFDSQ